MTVIRCAFCRETIRSRADAEYHVCDPAVLGLLAGASPDPRTAA